MKDEYEKFEVAVTAIIIKDGKYLLEQRSHKRKRYPLRWTVPGGTLISTILNLFHKTHIVLGTTCLSAHLREK